MRDSRVVGVCFDPDAVGLAGVVGSGGGPFALNIVSKFYESAIPHTSGDSGV